MPRRSFGKKSTIVILTIVVVLVAIRAMLPWAVKSYVNNVLKDDIDGYTGRVEDVDLSLWRGAYQLEGLTLQRIEGKVPAPFLDFALVDLSIAWGPLFRGHVVGNVTLDRARINITAAANEADRQTGTEGNGGWQESLDKIFPLSINHFVVRNSRIHYLDVHSAPKVDIHLSDIEATATNLSNVNKRSGALDSDLRARALLQDSGRLDIKSRGNIHATPLAYDVDLKLEDLALTRLNELFKAYMNFDVKSGQLSLYSEAATKDGQIKGYLKPLLRNVDVIQIKNDIEGPGELFSELIASQINLFIRRYSKDEVGTKIPFEGATKDLEVGVWTSIGNLFKHAFISDLKPQIDSEISESSVPGERRGNRDL